MPSHNHPASVAIGNNQHRHILNGRSSYASGSAISALINYGSGTGNGYTSYYTHSHTASATIGYSGNGDLYLNPYFSCFIWRRIN